MRKEIILDGKEISIEILNREVGESFSKNYSFGFCVCYDARKISTPFKIKMLLFTLGKNEKDYNYVGHDKEYAILKGYKNCILFEDKGCTKNRKKMIKK